MTSLGEIEAAIEHLTSDEVVELAAWIEEFRRRRSEDAADAEEVERAWLAEADRRWKEIESGSVETIPAARVMEEARRALEE